MCVSGEGRGIFSIKRNKSSFLPSFESYANSKHTCWITALQLSIMNELYWYGSFSIPHRHDNDTIDIMDHNHWCDLCSQRFIKNRSMVAYAQINLDCKDENDVSYANVANFTKPLNSSRLSTASNPRARSFWAQLNWWYSDVIGDRLQFISVRVTFIFKKKSRPNRFDNHYLDHLTT